MRLGTEKPPGASSDFRQSWMWVQLMASSCSFLSTSQSCPPGLASPVPQDASSRAGIKPGTYPCMDQSLEVSQETRSSSWKNNTFTIKSKTDTLVGRTGEAKARKEAPHRQEIWNAGRFGKLPQWSQRHIAQE